MKVKNVSAIRYQDRVHHSCLPHNALHSCCIHFQVWSNGDLLVYLGTTNNLLTGGMVDVSSPNDATIICTFLCGFTGSAQCQVQHGTDPSYTNLQYFAVSTETGTAGDVLTVVLREQLNSSTEYYYTVSAVVGDVTVTVQRNFTTPQYSISKYIHTCIQHIKGRLITVRKIRGITRQW